MSSEFGLFRFHNAFLRLDKKHLETSCSLLGGGGWWAIQ